MLFDGFEQLSSKEMTKRDNMLEQKQTATRNDNDNGYSNG